MFGAIFFNLKLLVAFTDIKAFQDEFPDQQGKISIMSQLKF